jgi:hypothetical protein
MPPTTLGLLIGDRARSGRSLKLQTQNRRPAGLAPPIDAKPHSCSNPILPSAPFFQTYQT